MSQNLMCCGRSRSRVIPILTSLLLMLCHLMPSNAQNSGCTLGSSPSECSMGVTTFNTETGCCELCSTCSGQEIFSRSHCNTTHDTLCDCVSPTSLDSQLGVCIVDCRLCPTGRCKEDTQECECARPECHSQLDIYCREPQCDSFASSAPTSNTVPPELHCIHSVTTYNADTLGCEPCSACSGREMLTLSVCNVTHDAVCGCRTPTFLDSLSRKCTLVCEDCPTGSCNDDGTACRCTDPQCHLPGDIYCREPIRPPCVPVIQPSTTKSNVVVSPNGFDQSSLPTWGIGLIAVGIVIGIIIFASCFLCMGLFSMHKSTDPESLQGSEASENGLVGRDSFASIGTNSTYMSSGSMYPYLSNHSMLELLKNSNPQLINPNNKLSSLQNSPISMRASTGGGTVRLAKNADSDKLTAVVL